MVKYKTIYNYAYRLLQCFNGPHLGINLRPYFTVSIIHAVQIFPPRAHLATRLMNKIDIAL
jgi:hypothetical protein